MLQPAHMDQQLAAVTQAMQERRFDDVGTMLDEVELQARPRSVEDGPRLARPAAHVFCRVQELSALSTEQWPHAVHLLAHVYAGRL